MTDTPDLGTGVSNVGPPIAGLRQNHFATSTDHDQIAD